MPETRTAVVDRIVDGETAVLLVEEDGETVDQLDLHVSELSKEAAREGMVVELAVDGGEIVSITPKPEANRERLKQNRDRIERLGTRLSDRDDQ